MNKQEIKALVKEIKNKKSESQTLEIKAAKNGCPTKLHPTLSSFSNQNEGGIILFGIDEDNDFEVCGVYDAQDLQKKVNAQSEQMSPKVQPDYSVEIIENKPIVLAEIPSVPFYDRPCYDIRKGINKGSYKRVGDADIVMDAAEIFDYTVFRKSIHSDREEIKDNREYLDSDRLNNFLTAVKRNKPNFKNSFSDREILNMFNIRKYDHLTKAGALIFSVYPQMYFPQLSIHALAHPGNEMGELGDSNERFLDNLDITGSIPEMLEESLEFIRRNIRNKTIIDENGYRNDRYDYPLTALREAILNALIHRDYSTLAENKPISINIFKDRIEVVSPGGIFGGEDVSQLGKTSMGTRNVDIVKILEILNVTGNRYSGVPTMRREMKSYNLPEPKFENFNNEFKVTFYNTPNIDLKKSELKETNKKKRTRRKITDEEILEYCSIPREREELKDFFNTDSNYIFSKRILPLVRKNKLRYLYPDIPQSPKQKYLTV